MCSRLVADAVPTIFSVPNPPQQLSTGRHLPKRRAINTESSPPTAAGAATYEVLTSSTTTVATRSDHTYCSRSRNADTKSTNAVPDNTCNSTSTVVRRRITAENYKHLRTVVLRQRVAIWRLRKKLSKLQTTNQQPNLSGIFANQASSAKKQLFAFYVRQARLMSVRKKFGHRFSATDKNFALSLYFCGPKAYAFCQRFFNLPSKRTLQLWLAKLNIKPGFSNSVISLLKKKVLSMADRDKICVLLLDEMSLKSALSYDAANDVIVGFEDYGHLGTGKELANSALVFMVKGISAKWKQPIGYFLSHNTTSADKLKSLVVSAIEKLSSIGLSVRVVICDQGATNQQMFKFFGVSASKPFADVGGSKVVFMFDSPHLLKNVRNNLVKHDFIIGEKRVSWKYIAGFYECDSKRSIRMAPRLSKKHIQLPPFSSMRVCLAAQVLSHTVAAGICTYVDIGKMPDEAMHTADFIKLVDGLFDTFNSRFIFDKKLLRRPISNKSDSNQWPFLHNCEQQLKSLQVADSKSKTASPCFAGWLMNINALKLLWEILKSEHNFSYLLTSRLNQDALENLFSVIRGRGGHRDNPDPVHFQSAFKQVLVQNMFVPAPSSNCEVDSGEYLLNLDDFSGDSITNALELSESMDTNQTSNVLLAASESFSQFDTNELMSDSVLDNTLTYIAGYVCRKVLDKHNCEVCRQTMLRAETTIIGDKDLFCTHKAYNTSHGCFGGLRAPSDFIIQLLKQCELAFNNLFETLKHVTGIKRQLVDAICDNLLSDADKPCIPSPCIQSQRNAISIYVTTRLHYKLKFLKRDAAVSTKPGPHKPVKRKNRKAQKIMHK